MNKVVYHGSPKGDIDALEARVSTHRKKCIYATDDRAIAMMFMSRGNGDLDTVKQVMDDMPMLVERRPGVLEELYDKPGYIYELPGETFEHYDYLWRPEVISFEERIAPLNVEYHENILESLRKMAVEGRLVLYEYPSRPLDIPLDNSDLIDKYMRFEEMGIEGAVASLLKIYPEFKERVEERRKAVKGVSK